MIRCPICDHSFQESHYSEKYVSKYNNQEYKKYECDRCDVHFWYPLEIIPEFYEDEFEEAYEFFHESVPRPLRPIYKMLFKYCPVRTGKLLDVGCGDGLFLKKAQKRGFEVCGIDFDRKSIKKAREEFGLKNVFAMSLKEFEEFSKKENWKFDVITFWEVLEHQDKPREFINIVKSLLNQGGYIAGCVPNRESKVTEIWIRKISTADLPPHHFLRFSKYALKRFFEREGFNDILVITLEGSPLRDIVYGLQITLLGSKFPFIKELFRTQILGSDRDIAIFKTKGFRKNIYDGLRFIRDIVMFPLAILLKRFLQSHSLYFQAKI